jgi:hypothetical protein
MMKNNSYEEIYALIQDILNHHPEVDEVKFRMDELTAEYGKSIFPEIVFEKKEKPWDEAYLQELKDKNITGACSKDFILHMAEVSRYLYERKRNMIIIGIIVVIVAVVVVIMII